MTTPISFELAIVLKEKGFDLKVRSSFCEENLHIDTNTKGNYNDINWVRSWRNSPIDDVISAPTIAEACMWFYEKHGIWIYIRFDYASRKWYYIIQKISTINEISSRNDFVFNSPTEAYEAAFEYTLKNYTT